MWTMVKRVIIAVLLVKRRRELIQQIGRESLIEKRMAGLCTRPAVDP